MICARFGTKKGKYINEILNKNNGKQANEWWKKHFGKIMTIVNNKMNSKLNTLLSWCVFEERGRHNWLANTPSILAIKSGNKSRNSWALKKRLLIPLERYKKPLEKFQ